MSKTIFSHDLRMSLCERCGAPIEASIGGGLVACRYCGAQMTLSPRDESRDQAMSAVQPAVSEAERFERLRAQDGKPMLPPPALQQYVVGGALPAELVPQALADFQRARYEVASGASFGSAERLYFLTLLLYGQLSQQRKDAEVRALLETARDRLTDPRHRQVIHGMLARNAARVGDVAAAEEWLKLLNPRAADIYMDTAFRFSRAYVSTVRGDLRAVLTVLGTQIDDVPIADGQDEVCALLRANAHERTGQGQLAVQQLTQIIAGDPGRDRLLGAIVAANQELGLCPQSLPMARAQQQQVQSNAIHTRSGFNIGALLITIFAGVGLTLGLDFAAWAIVPSAMIGIVHTLIILGSIGLTFLLVFGAIARANAARKELLEKGVPGRARIVQVNGTGVRVNGQPMLELHLQVQVPGRGAYVAIHKEVISPGLMPRLAVGAQVGVRVHPSDPAQMAVDWQSG